MNGDRISLAEAQKILSDSRFMLKTTIAGISTLARFDPDKAAQGYNHIKPLVDRQLQLEEKFKPGVQPLGFIWWLIPLAGTVLVGGGAYLWKHHEDVSLEKQRIDLYNNCINAKVAAGMTDANALKACQSLLNPDDFDISGLIRNLTILSVVLMGGYFVLKLKK